MVEVSNRLESSVVIPLITKDELKHELQTKVADITFQKVDGTMREMKCTLISNLLPKPELTEEELGEKVTRMQNPNVLPVWDLDKDEWRSMRVDSIKSICYHVD